MTEPSDHSLFAAAQGGDFNAFEQVVERYHERVYRLAMGMIHSPSDAEEVVQETFLSMFRNLHTLKNETAPSSWIYRIAVNAALMRLRQRRRKPLLSIEDQPPPTVDVSLWPSSTWAQQPDAQLLSKEVQGRIEEAISRLPDKYRLVLLLRDVEGRNNEEVADALGLTVPTVKSRLHRARLLVREVLQTYFQKRT